MRSHVTALGAILLSLVDSIYSQSLPYTPTSILFPRISSSNKDIAYVFTQASDLSGSVFASLNVSSTISASDISLNTITSSLPFANDESKAIIPSISANGEITVYAGSCSTSQSSSLWRFTPANSSSTGGGTWSQTPKSSSASAELSGANFLSSGFSFSTFVHANDTQTDLYVFGGMCPKSTSNTSTWQSAASYSNRMLRFSPISDSAYALDIANNRGPPIAEAGFTITGLTPTYSNGSGVLTQQQNFVLLGGHTESAFINMSQVAIWSVPEESWSFISVDSPPSSANPNTELIVKSTVTNVDSRSGHTAVLTEDGSKIIVLGGWVGDVSQAADPQLVVLDLGTGFGGSGDWAWSIPSQQPSGSGTYGHGAAMLPGNVMMVLGGYNISSSGSSKRDIRPETPSMFLNATSLTWMSNYTNPAFIAAVAGKSNSSSSRSKAKNIGLGAGLGLGFLIIFIAIATLLWYRRRQRWRREEARERDIHALSRGAAEFYSPTREVGQRSGDFPWAHSGWNKNGDQAPVYDSSSAVAGYESIHAGSAENREIPPPPKRISRKPLKSRNARGLYQPAPNFEQANARANSLGTAGPIHPIYETDEEDHALGKSKVGIALGEPPTRSNRYSDPFKDPSGSIAASFRRDNRSTSTPSPESPSHDREREIQAWIADWAAADALLNSQARSHSSGGRLSPSRRAQLIAATSVSSVSGEEDSGRTASNLSERSIAVSAMTVSRSGSSSQRSRSNSLRGFIATAMTPFTSTLLSTTAASTTLSPIFDGPGFRANQPPRSAGSGSSSFTTAHTSFGALKVEGETLLPRPDEERSYTHLYDDSPGSPSKSKKSASIRNRTGWLGSIRRAFVGEAVDSQRSSLSPSPFPNRDLSHIQPNANDVPPRRTMSAAATLWRRKQGKGDWEDSEDEFSGQQARSNTFSGSLAGGEGRAGLGDEDDEWDIERAVQNRVVQVMFTVPKERLRVVNGRASEELDDDGKSVKSTEKGMAEKEARAEEKVEPQDVPMEDGKSEDPEKNDCSAEDTRRARPNGKVLGIVEIIEGRGGSPER